MEPYLSDADFTLYVGDPEYAQLASRRLQQLSLLA